MYCTLSLSLYIYIYMGSLYIYIYIYIYMGSSLKRAPVGVPFLADAARTILCLGNGVKAQREPRLDNLHRIWGLQGPCRGSTLNTKP